MKKKYFLIALAIVALALGGFLIWRKGRIAEEASPSQPEGALLETPLEERPYVTMMPRADGKEFTLEISRIKNAKTIEYELVYLSQGLSRGVIGSITLKEGEEAVSRKLLLGTCSRNVCKYDEGVEEGTLTLRFRGAEGTRKFISEFHLQQGDKELTSTDGNFSLEGSFSTAFYLTISTIGLPKEIEGKVIGGPYGVFTAGSKSVRNGEVTLKLDEENDSAQLFSWTGKAWQEIKDTEIEGKTVSASVTSLATFVVTAPKE